MKSEMGSQYHSKSEVDSLNIVATLKSFDELDHLSALGVDVFLVHTEQFTRNKITSFSIQEIKDLTQAVHRLNKKLYILINVMIHEEMTASLNLFLKDIKEIGIDGIVAFDFSLFPFLKKQNMESMMIYQPGTMNTNNYDSWFSKSQGLKGLTISKEITLAELLEVSGTITGIEYSYVGHGYLEMFYSRRPLLTNYHLFKGNSIESIKNNHHFSLQEELRVDEMYPVIEDEFGTTIFRSKKLSSFQEIGVIFPYIHDFFIERIFLSDEEYYKSITAYTHEKSQSSFMSVHQDEYDSGFYYRPIGRSKEDLS